MWMCVAKNEPDLLRFLVASSDFEKFEKFPYFCLPWAISNKQFEIAKILMSSGLRFPQYVLEDTRKLISKTLNSQTLGHKQKDSKTYKSVDHMQHKIEYKDG